MELPNPKQPPDPKQPPKHPPDPRAPSRPQTASSTGAAPPGNTPSRLRQHSRIDLGLIPYFSKPSLPSNPVPLASTGLAMPHGLEGAVPKKIGKGMMGSSQKAAEGFSSRNGAGNGVAGLVQFHGAAKLEVLGQGKAEP